MVQIRLKGPQTGSDLGAVDATVNGTGGGTVISAFRNPARVSTLPRISDGFDTSTFSLDTGGLTGITTYSWREVGGAVLGSAETLSGTGHGDKWIECEVTCDQGVILSPPVQVYASGMAGMNKDDAAVMALVPQAEATHIAVTDGNWSDPGTWHGGQVPKNGAFAFIPHQRSVTYDNIDRNVRLDRVRVDGTLTWSLTQSTDMLVETIVGGRGSEIIIGTSAGRLPAGHSATIIFSCKDYSAHSYMPTDINAGSFSATRGWGRGLVSLGLLRVWGNEKRTWTWADGPVAQGATSLTLSEAATGIEIGDEILIGATTNDATQTTGIRGTQDELRTITGITGRTLSWSAGLAYPHDNQSPGSTRADIAPIVMLRGGKNVVFRSEVSAPAHRRGHTAVMHMHSRTDIWDAAFVDLGRTDKSGAAGVIDGTGAFKFMDGTLPVKTEPLTPRSNLQSRYPIHLHHAGFEHADGETPIVNNCYVEDTPGWAMVHHNCHAKFDNNAIFRFYGSGMVSESASELGSWVGNLACQTTYDGSEHLTSPKDSEGSHANYGDAGRSGYGFYFRGRAMRTNRNHAQSVNHGHVFYHRETNQTIAPVVNLDRRRLDIQTAGLVVKPNNGATVMSFVDYPIIHFADNSAMACVSGLFVTKDFPKQSHDVNVKLKRLRTVGCLRGAEIEYVGSYIVDRFDILGGAAGTSTNNSGLDGTYDPVWGISLSGNAWQIGTVNARIEGVAEGLVMNGVTTQLGSHDACNTTDNPRYFNIGPDLYNCAEDIVFNTPAGGKATELVTRTEMDFEGSFIDYDAAPSDSFPLILGTSDGVGTYSANPASNGDGQKSDNLASTGNIAPKVYEDQILPKSDENVRNYISVIDGYWQYGGDNVAVIPDIISDRLTGRPEKRVKIVRYTGSVGGYVDKGTFTYAATPCVQSDKTVVVATSGSVDIDVVSGATGAGGPGSYSLDTKDFIAPDQGKARLNESTGIVTYQPDPGYSGTDEMYVFVKSEGRYATVRITVLIGAGGAVTAPVPGIHFSAADHAEPNTIAVSLHAAPDTGGRRIDRVEYSTDGGSTWRRLCHKWIRAEHKVKTTSSGAGVGPGSYTLRIRYLTDFDFAISAAPSDAAVTIS